MSSNPTGRAKAASVPPPGSTRARLDSLTPIEQVVASKQFKIAYQPIFNLQTRLIMGAEALVRSTSASFKDPPSLFKAAVEHGLCGELGRHIRRMAVDGCPDVPLFLNIHPAEFDQGWLVLPDDAIFGHGQNVYLEITESVPLSHFRLCHSVLREIRSKGVLLAIDDFGAGYSNIKYIAELSPQIVKLDRELLQGAATEKRVWKLLRSIVDMCEQQGALVIAEGIETIDERSAVEDAGVHFGQGYLFARPSFEVPTPRLLVPEVSREADAE